MACTRPPQHPYVVFFVSAISTFFCLSFALGAGKTKFFHHRYVTHSSLNQMK